jgi:maspardin
VFFYQVQILSAKGYRVISAQYPSYNNPEDWSKGFDHFLDMMRCRSVHIFGAGLGGFLAQHFAGRYPHRVRSLMLCNAFASTRCFAEKAGALASVVHITPTPILRKVMLDSFPQAPMTLQAKQALDFVASQVNEISGIDLAGRLSLNSTDSSAAQMSLEADKLTIIESSGETMVPEELRRDLQRRYASSRKAELKSGGDFPFLSRPEETAMFVEVHMRGVGVFANGIVPSLANAAAANDSGGASHWSYQYDGQRDEVDPFQAQIQVEPEYTPKWVNPFEDDGLL